MISLKWIGKARALFKRALREETASTAIEFAFVAPPFLAITLAIIQSAVIWFAKSELQAATENAARLVLTEQSGVSTAAQFQNALCPNLPVIIQCSNTIISLTTVASLSGLSSGNTSPPTLTYDANNNPTNANAMPYTAGSYGQIQVLQVLYQLPVVSGPLFNFATQPNGTLLLVAVVVFQNEPK